MIPNPSKKVTVSFPIDQVQEGILRVPTLNNKYKMYKKNEMFNSFTLEAYEFLSMGVYIDFNLSEVSNDKTEIQIEIRRKIGAFDEWYEVQNANKHMETLTLSLSQAITMDKLEFEKLLSENTDTSQATQEQESSAGVIIGVVAAFLILWFIFT
jgi:hypothetical protein